MKILIFTPFWKRPEIVKEYVKSINRLTSIPDHTFELLAVVSPEDPDLHDIRDHLSTVTVNTHLCYTKNSPLGLKKTIGAEMAKYMDWDYLLELNSDSMVNPEIFAFYKGCMDMGCKFWGLNNLWAVDFKTKETIFIEDYNCGHSFGSGQMLHRSVFSPYMWDVKSECGMDSQKISHLGKMDVPDTVLDCGATPMIVDYKVDTTIWHFRLLKRKGIAVDYRLIKDVIDCS